MGAAIISADRQNHILPGCSPIAPLPTALNGRHNGNYLQGTLGGLSTMTLNDVGLEEFVEYVRGGAIITGGGCFCLTAEHCHTTLYYSAEGGIKETVYWFLTQAIGNLSLEEKHEIAMAVLENLLYRQGVTITETCHVSYILAECMEYGELPEVIQQEGFAWVADQLLKIILERRSVAQSPPSPPEKPDWDPTNNILYYRGRGVPVDPKAYRMRPVLDAFHANAWRAIQTPFQCVGVAGQLRPDMPRSYQTLKDLNKKFDGLLYFRVVGPTLHWSARKG
jgi:hypothetical protein